MTMTTRRVGRATRLWNLITFPVRAAVVLQRDIFGMQSLRSERLSYVAEEVRGRTLDVGCGPGDAFVREWLNGNGTGIDVYQYEGLDVGQVVEDMTQLPFNDGEFDTVTLIAAINHIPEPLRADQLAELHRVTSIGGQIIVTMAAPLAEVVVHNVLHRYTDWFGVHQDMDGERGMEDEEDYYVRDEEIVELLVSAGFSGVRVRRFWSQWGVNKMFLATRRA
ncbi:MAG: methyltransferase domain-containing protein [Acidimicrobiales bacterium]|nr:methyltransferase domain-containing protein [Acidimicrobiales bacterium]